MASSPTQLLLTRVDHEAKMINVMRTLFSSGLMTDVILSCEGQVIYAHRLVLASVSSYFQSIFQSPLVANQPNPIVILKDMKLVDLKAIIEFIYNGEVRVPENQLESLVKSAETLDISGLSRICTHPMNHVLSSPAHISPAEPTLRDVSSNININNLTHVDQESTVDAIPPKNLEDGQKVGKKYQLLTESTAPSSVQTRRSHAAFNSSNKTREEESGQKTAICKGQKRYVTSEAKVTESELHEQTTVLDGHSIASAEKRASEVSLIFDLFSFSLINFVHHQRLNTSPSPRPMSPDSIPSTRVRRATSSEDTESNYTPEPSDRLRVYGKLIVSDGSSGPAKEILIHKAEFAIGRDRTNDYRINTPLIARQHCSIIRDQGHPKLIIRAKDTKLNGQPVSGEVNLKELDLIQVGPALLIVRFDLTHEELDGKELIPVPIIPSNLNNRGSQRKSTSESKEIPDQKGKQVDDTEQADNSSIQRTESSLTTRSKVSDEASHNSANDGNSLDISVPQNSGGFTTSTRSDGIKRETKQIRTRLSDGASRLSERLPRSMETRPSRYSYVSKRLRAKQLKLRETNRRRLFGQKEEKR